jgi:hypothetical protein
MAKGPGLRKIDLPKLFRERAVRLVSLSDGRMREIVESADVVSEGATREEASGLVYYGSTSIVLAGEPVAHVGRDLVVFALRHDPHTRLRLVRVAYREAASRVPSAALAFHHEIALDVSDRRIVVSVDVMARLASAPSAMGE